MTFPQGLVDHISSTRRAKQPGGALLADEVLGSDTAEWEVVFAKGWPLLHVRGQIDSTRSDDNDRIDLRVGDGAIDTSVHYTSLVQNRVFSDNTHIDGGVWFIGQSTAANSASTGNQEIIIVQWPQLEDWVGDALIGMYAISSGPSTDNDARAMGVYEIQTAGSGIDRIQFTMNNGDVAEGSAVQVYGYRLAK